MTALEAPAVASVPLEQAVWAALEDVHDPEIPGLSVVDLGIIGGVHVAPGSIRVEILPTFVACPAIELIREGVRERLAPFAPRVEAAISFAEPWTSDRITPLGRRRLREAGFAPPRLSASLETEATALLPVIAVATCPYCGSRDTALENAFGPTLCRSIHHCRGCLQPFEAFKEV